MKKYLAGLLALALPAVVFVPNARVYSKQRERARPQYVENQIIVKLKADLAESYDSGYAPEFVFSARRARVEPLTATGGKGPFLVKLDEGVSVEEAVEQASLDPRVEYAEPDYLLYPARTPDDAFFSSQWSLYNTENAGADIGATLAWDITTGNQDVVVAVIDSGADLSHIDLADNAWVNPGEVAGDGADNDKNGFVDDINGWDFKNNRANTYEDPNIDLHGTHVSGIIGAVGNNGRGVSGVAWHVKIMSLKFLGSKTGSTSDAVKAINYAVDQRKRGVNLRAINASWGSPDGGDKVLKDAIIAAGKAGILFVTAAGNNRSDIDESPDYPSEWSTEVDSIISVAAVNSSDQISSYSNYGHSRVQVTAPGDGVMSTIPGGQYGMLSGTSMATPHVTGVAALLFSREPSLTPAQARERIVRTAVPCVSAASRCASSGRVSAVNALTNTVPQSPARPAVARVTTSKKVVTVDGIGFVSGSSIIEVNGAALSKIKYDGSFALADGSVTQMTAKLGKNGIKSTFPQFNTVTVTVFNPATGERSAPFFFTRR